MIDGAKSTGVGILQDHGRFQGGMVILWQGQAVEGELSWNSEGNLFGRECLDFSVCGGGLFEGTTFPCRFTSTSTH